VVAQPGRLVFEAVAEEHTERGVTGHVARDGEPGSAGQIDPAAHVVLGDRSARWRAGKRGSISTLHNHLSQEMVTVGEQRPRTTLDPFDPAPSPCSRSQGAHARHLDDITMDL